MTDLNLRSFWRNDVCRGGLRGMHRGCSEAIETEGSCTVQDIDSATRTTLGKASSRVGGKMGPQTRAAASKRS